MSDAKLLVEKFCSVDLNRQFFEETDKCETAVSGIADAILFSADNDEQKALDILYDFVVKGCKSGSVQGVRCRPVKQSAAEACRENGLENKYVSDSKCEDYCAGKTGADLDNCVSIVRRFGTQRGVALTRVSPAEACEEKGVKELYVNNRRCEDYCRGKSGTELDNCVSEVKTYGSRNIKRREDSQTAVPWFQFDSMGFYNIGSPSYSGDVAEKVVDEWGYETGGQYPTTYAGGLAFKLRLFPGIGSNSTQLGFLIKPFDFNYGKDNRPNVPGADGNIGMLGFGLSVNHAFNSRWSLIGDLYYNRGYSFGGNADGKVQQAGNTGSADVSADGFGAAVLVQFNIKKWFGVYVGGGFDGLYNNDYELIMGNFGRILGGMIFAIPR